MKENLKKLKMNWQIYVFLMLPFLYIIVFAYAPMGGVLIAFKKYNPNLGIFKSEWIGLANFIRFFKSYQFERIIVNTLRISIYSLVAGFPIPILFALLLNTINANLYKRIVQTVTYMPHFISIVVLVGMIIQILNPVVGIYAKIYRLLGFVGQPEDLLASPSAFPHIYVWSGVWQHFGWDSIIYIAALSAVNPELHEAAEIDGATRLQRVFHVDFPAILPTATIMLILRFGQIMGVGFEKVYLLQNSLNLRTSEVISTYVYKVGIGSQVGTRTDYSYGTAIGLFNSVINLFLVIIMNKITKKLGETSLW